MFTGLIEQTGKLIRRTPSESGAGARLAIGCAMDRLVLGESIAVDGVCLTVDVILSGRSGGFECDASAETLSKTTLGDLALGGDVNLERAMPLGGRMGGHIVSGHVDGTGTLASKKPQGAAVELAFAFPPELLRFIASKGSICVNGVSLTVNGVHDGPRTFDVVVIPHTQDKTSLGRLSIGQKVNLEIDLVARYVARLVDIGGAATASNAETDASLLAQLKRSGYT